MLNPQGALALGFRADAAQSHRAATDAGGELAAITGRRHEPVELAGKRRRRCQVYEQYAANFVGKSDRECDLLGVKVQRIVEKNSRRNRTVTIKGWSCEDAIGRF